MQKRVIFLSVLICLALCISFSPSAALASEEPEVVSAGSCGKDLTWTLEDGVLTISGTGKMRDYSWDSGDAPWSPYNDFITSVIIEDGVTHIGAGAFIGCPSLTGITVPASVETFGDFLRYAFYDCPGLKTAGPIGGGFNYEFGWTESIPPSAFAGCGSLQSVTFPDGLTDIGAGAFTDAGLTSITIPAGVTGIGEKAFDGCTSLAAIDVSAENECFASQDGVLFDKDMTTLLCVPCGKTGAYSIPAGLTGIRSDTFYGCESLESVTIPDDITSIGRSMFFRCASLKNVTIPDSVTEIGGSAFYGCASLTEIVIPDSVTSIGGGAFYGCASLTEITIPVSVTSIGTGAFDNCTGLRSITLPDSVTNVENSMFRGCTSLESVTLPDSVKSIGSTVFQDCSGLRSITLPEGVTSIGGGAFYGCTGLTEITLPSGLTGVGPTAFWNCSALTNVTIPNGVTSIGYLAFGDCTSLTGITIPESVTSIGDEAFFHCESLTDVYYGGSEADWKGVAIGDYNEPLENAAIHFAGTEPADGPAPANMCGENLTWALEDGVLTISGSGEMKDYSLACAPWQKYCMEITGLVIEPGVTSIGSAAFYFCPRLTSVTIPDSVTSIGAHAFFGCSELSMLTIPDSVTTIGENAFYDCIGLTKLRLGSGVKSIGLGAFTGCVNLREITIPNGVTSIGELTFFYCGRLTEITLPASVTSIGNAAFSGCENLTDVYYGGSGSDWADIAISDYNNYLLNAKIHFATPAPEPLSVVLDENAAVARVTGDCRDLYVRVALVLDMNGQSGLFVTQVPINDSGNIYVPEFMVPGLTVMGVNVALVPTLADISSTVPNTVSSDFRRF